VLHPDLMYEVVMQEHQARIDTAEQSRQARLARTGRRLRPATSLFAALFHHRTDAGWTGVGAGVRPRYTSEDQPAIG
jgi:hypothetical protein